VDLFIGYFSGASADGGIHSPKHCLPGSGWSELSSERAAMRAGDDTLRLVRAVYGMGQSRTLLLYWFQMRDKTINDEYSLKLNEVANSVLYRRRDESFVRVSVPVRGDADAAREAGEGFVRDFYPLIRSFLPG
jgi:EpsI family protein